MYKIVFDCREAKLIDLWTQTSLQENTSSNLDIGDVQIQDASSNIVVVFERKTVADFVASIKDGRWREQKLRLLNACITMNFMLVYIIEGTNFTFNEEGNLYGISSKALVTSIMNAMFRDKIYIVQTKHTLDTIDFLRSFLRRLPEQAGDWLSTDTRTPLLEQHQDAMIKAKKKDNVTTDTVFAMQLCAIPGISSKKGALIREGLGVKSMKEVIEKLSPFDRGLEKLLAIKGVGSIMAHEILHQLGISKN